MRTEFFVEFEGQQINLEDIESAIKSNWRLDGNKVKDLQSLQIYYKPREHKAYYVINGESKGEEDSLMV